jgi:NAD(P)-dependent dehydrogenase (short-subunit alcohol dehydrogenase family)
MGNRDVSNGCDVNTPMKEVEGKVAFITGGSSGIGLGMARAFADAGMKVVIGYRTKDHLDAAMKYLESAGDRVHASNVDVTDRPGMEKAAEETIQVFGKIHVLVNNAGVGLGVTLSNATYDDWDWEMSVNLDGVFNGVRSFLKHIKAHGEGGQIVTTSSIHGLVVNPSVGIYSTCKFAVVGMMEALRADLAGTNIGVSVYCPGLVNSNFMDSNRNRPNNLADTGFKADPSSIAARREAMKNIFSMGMDPLEAGQLVLRGIRNNDLYILTHPEFEQGIRDRNEALIASIPSDLHPPEARVGVERALLRNSVYINERDRKLAVKVPGS